MRAVRPLLLATALALAALPLTQVTAGAATSAAPRFIGQGTTYWEYAGNDGTGNLTVKFDTTEPGLAPNQADVTYTFDSGLQPFFVNSGQIVVTGDWTNGWSATTANPESHVDIGPFGDGQHITFHVDGFLVTQSAGLAQGPWEVDGTFAPTQSF